MHLERAVQLVLAEVGGDAVDSSGGDNLGGAMGMKDLHLVGSCEAARLIREGAITSVEVVQACLARGREVDGQVQAWALLDPHYALAQAGGADEARLMGEPKRDQRG